MIIQKTGFNKIYLVSYLSHDIITLQLVHVSSRVIDVQKTVLPQIHANEAEPVKSFKTFYLINFATIRKKIQRVFEVLVEIEIIYSNRLFIRVSLAFSYKEATYHITNKNK